jgi:hypothetical protein
MTTIACDGKSMVGDSRLCGDFIDTRGVPKVFVIRPGYVFDGSSDHQDVLLFRDWLANGGEKPKFESEFQALVWHQGGLWRYEIDVSGGVLAK